MLIKHNCNASQMLKIFRPIAQHKQTENINNKSHKPKKKRSFTILLVVDIYICKM